MMCVVEPKPRLAEMFAAAFRWFVALAKRQEQRRLGPKVDGPKGGGFDAGFIDLSKILGGFCPFAVLGEAIGNRLERDLTTEEWLNFSMDISCTFRRQPEPAPFSIR